MYSKKAVTLFRIYLLIASILMFVFGFAWVYSPYVIVGAICWFVSVLVLILAAVAPSSLIDKLIDWGSF